MSGQEQRGRRLVLAGVSALAILIADRVTKNLVEAKLRLSESVPVVAGWVDLVRVENPGAAFSLFADWSPGVRQAVLVAYSVIAILILAWLIFRPWGKGRLVPISLGLILGGAAGNLVDRLRTGRVVDFVDLHWGGWHWPAFNVADSAITIGVALLLLLGWRDEAGRPGSKSPEKVLEK
ncbi:MAG: signal peptidase II [Nitrospirota bacterium]